MYLSEFIKTVFDSVEATTQVFSILHSKPVSFLSSQVESGTSMSIPLYLILAIQDSEATVSPLLDNPGDMVHGNLLQDM